MQKRMYPPDPRNFLPVEGACDRARGMVSYLGPLGRSTQGSVKMLTRDIASDPRPLGMLTQSLAGLKHQQEPLIPVNEFVMRDCLNGFDRNPFSTKLMRANPMKPKVLVSTYH